MSGGLFTDMHGMRARLIIPVIGSAVLALAVAGCGSSGNANPVPSYSGAQGDADSYICSNVASGSSPYVPADTQNAATPYLDTLWGQWSTAYNDHAMGDAAVSDADVVQAAAAADAWCAANGFGS
jgi:hypothetical protein